MTAWQALVDHAELKPGEQVLVQGGSGAVGSFAVQLAAILGGQVTATGRGGNADFVLALGAGRHCSADDLRSQAQGQFDVVIDTVGGAVLDSSYDLPGRRPPRDPERPAGCQDKAASRNIHAMFFIVEPDPAALAGLAERASAKTLRPVISQEFPLAEGRQAYESDRRRRPPGKTILVVR